MFGYDEYGNLTSMAKLGHTIALPVETSSNRLMGIGYDAAGNVVTLGAQHFDYDALGMPNTIRVGANPQPRIIYAYTADDERVFSFDVSTGVTHWTIRGLDNKVLRDFRQEGNNWSVARDYVYRDGLLLAALKSGGAVEHYTLDHLGTPRLTTDGAGNKIGYHVYWPFGEEWTTGGDQEASPLQFTGHERDGDPSGGSAPLDYMHARYYEAGAGRYLSVDRVVDPQRNSADPQKWNRYAYAHGNPITFIDPDGNAERIYIDNQTTGATRATVDQRTVTIQVRAKYVAARVDVSVDWGTPQVRDIARAHLAGDQVRVIHLVDAPSPSDTPAAAAAVGHVGQGPAEVHVGMLAGDNPATRRDERSTATANAVAHEVGHEQGLSHNQNTPPDVMSGPVPSGTLQTPLPFNQSDAQKLQEPPTAP